MMAYRFRRLGKLMLIRCVEDRLIMKSNQLPNILSIFVLMNYTIAVGEATVQSTRGCALPSGAYAVINHVYAMDVTILWKCRVARNGKCSQMQYRRFK